MNRKHVVFTVLLTALLLMFTAASAADTTELLPYANSNAWVKTDGVTICKTEYPEGLQFQMGYTGYSNGNTAEVAYNLKGEYSTFSFLIGFMSGAEADAKLTVLADGRKLADEETIPYNASRGITLQVSGVHQLIIRLTSDGSYDKKNYAIANIRAARSSAPADKEPYISDEFYDVIRTGMKYTELLTGDFTMGGRKYTNGYRMTMGYGFGVGHTNSVTLNFNNQYHRMTFETGKIMPSNPETYTRSAYLTIKADGVVVAGYDQKEMKWNDLVLPVSLNVTGVNELVISIKSDGYDKVKWGIGNIQLESDKRAHGILFDASAVTVTTAARTRDLNPRVYPSDAANKEFTIDSDSYITAMVTQNGIVCGRHKGTAIITATTKDGGHTATCKVTSKLLSTKFVPSIHGWGFGNLEVSGLDPQYKDLYQRICGDATAYAMSDSLLWDKLVDLSSLPSVAFHTLRTIMLGGLCGGLSISAALTYTGDIPFSTWSWHNASCEKPFDVDDFYASAYSSSLDMTFQEFVVASHLTQSTFDFISQEYTTKNNYQRLFDGVTNFQNTGKNPVVLKLNKSGVEHIVLPYEVFTIDKQVFMFLYEPNTMISGKYHPDIRHIVFNLDEDGNVTDWDYTTFDYSSKDTDMKVIGNLSVFASRMKKQTELGMPKGLFVTSATNFSAVSGSSTLKSSGGSYSISGKDVLPYIPAEKNSTLSGSAIMTSGGGAELTLAEGARASTAYYAQDYACIIQSAGTATVGKADSANVISVVSIPDDQISIRCNIGDLTIIAEGTVPKKATAAIDPAGSAVFTGFSDVKTTIIKDGVEQTGDQLPVPPGVSFVINEDGSITVIDSSTGVMPRACENCYNLTSVCIPTDVVAIGDYAFRNCRELETLILHDDIVYISENAFEGCSKLTITASEGSYVQKYCEKHDIPCIVN